MAASATETNFIRLGGSTPGLCLLTLTVDLDTDTSFAITPGAGTVAGAASMKNILYWSVTNSAGERAFQAVKSSSAGADLLTITGTAEDTFDVVLVGVDSGSESEAA